MQNMYLKDVRVFISKNETEKKIMPINLKQYSTFVYGNFRDTRNQFRDTFLNVVPKFTRKEKYACAREHFVQYFTFVHPPLCDVKPDIIFGYLFC